MTDAVPGFGDRVRVRVTPETQSRGVAGRLGVVFGVTTPSAGHVTDVVGHSDQDCAINVNFESDQSDVWLVPELVEFVGFDVGAEIRLDGVPKRWVREADGGWREEQLDAPSRVAPRPQGFRAWIRRLFE